MAYPSAGENFWRSVTYGDGIFVAVSYTTWTEQVATFPDDQTWTGQSSAAGNNWMSVTWGNRTFVAVAKSGIGNRVMTSSSVGEQNQRGRQQLVSFVRLSQTFASSSSPPSALIMIIVICLPLLIAAIIDRSKCYRLQRK